MISLFPLTVLEECYYWENMPAYPCSWFARLRFSGCLDRTGLKAAIIAALRRHPLLTAKVQIVGEQLNWFIADDFDPVIHWEIGPVGGSLPPAGYQDIQQEMGIRFHVRIDTTASELTIQVHHACCDGMGGCQFIGDLLLAYAATCADPTTTEPPPLDLGRLEGRTRFRIRPRQLAGLYRTAKFMMRTPVPLIPQQACFHDAAPPEGYPTMLRYIFDEEATARVQKTSQHLGVTLNDLLATDLFLAMADWRSSQNLEDGGWLRMMIPVSLRTAGDGPSPAANVLGGTYLDRRQPDFADATRLLKSIHKEMAFIKRWGIARLFVALAEQCRRRPGRLERMIRADKCRMSIVFSNFGKPLRHLPLPRRDGRVVAGNVTLEGIDFVAPTRPYLCVNTIVALYDNKLSFTLHYDQRALSHGQATDLFAAYMRRIQSSAASGGP